MCCARWHARSRSTLPSTPHCFTCVGRVSGIPGTWYPANRPSNGSCRGQTAQVGRLHRRIHLGNPRRKPSQSDPRQTHSPGPNSSRPCLQFSGLSSRWSPFIWNFPSRDVNQFISMLGPEWDPSGTSTIRPNPCCYHVLRWAHPGMTFFSGRHVNDSLVGNLLAEYGFDQQWCLADVSSVSPLLATSAPTALVHRGTYM